MSVVWLTRRKRIQRGKGFGRIEYELPDAPVCLPEAEELAADAAEATRESICQNIQAGRDAEGVQHRPVDSTVKRRDYDRQPPGRARGPRGAVVAEDRRRRKADVGPMPAAVFRTSAKTGRLKKVNQSRWAQRYPDGRGSEGSSRSFTDSGYLTRNIGLELEGKSAFVTVPSARMTAVLALEKRGISLFGINPRTLDFVLRDHLTGAVFNVGRAMNRFTRGLVRGAARLAAGALAVPLALGAEALGGDTGGDA